MVLGNVSVIAIISRSFSLIKSNNSSNLLESWSAFVYIHFKPLLQVTGGVCAALKSASHGVLTGLVHVGGVGQSATTGRALRDGFTDNKLDSICTLFTRFNGDPDCQTVVASSC